MFKAIQEWCKRVRKAREDRIAYQTLQTFSDRQLQDIGLSRGEVYRKVFDVTKIRESGL